MSAPFREFRYVSRDGLMLYARDYGDATSPWLPVVCLPGLTRTSRDFDALATHLAQHRQRPRRVVAFDYRGRGQSAADGNVANYNVVTEMGDVLDGLAALGIPRAAIAGTSRGGIIGMLMAFSRPQTVAALVLNDIGPYIEPQGLLRLKSYVGRTPRAADWKDAIRIQSRLHGAQFSGYDSADWQEFTRLTYRDDNGAPVSDYDPRLSETLASVDLDKPAPGIWNEFRALQAVPVLVIRGANSDILSAATVERMASEHRRVETIVVDGEGHPPMLRPGQLLQRIAAFVADAEDRMPAPISTEADLPGD